tara:strand:+ start:1429 stop:1632 length:204 start_codon:yes stop_codon:yes gene_type:complete
MRYYRSMNRRILLIVFVSIACGWWFFIESKSPGVIAKSIILKRPMKERLKIKVMHMGTPVLNEEEEI